MFYDTLLPTLSARRNAAGYTCGDESVTNGELLCMAAGIFSRIASDAPVALYGHKQPYMKAAVLACICAGVPYVPLDSSLPRARLEMILQRTQPALITGDWPYGGDVPVLPAHLCAAADDSALRVRPRSPDAPCYILFTSGSSGKPKGVRVSYANVDTCVRWLQTLVPKPRGSILNQARFSFDLSVADLYLSFLYGAHHVAIPDGEARDFPLLFSRLRQSGAQIAVWTPSYAQFLLTDRAFNETLLPELRTILFCGEPLLPALAQKLLDRFPHTVVFNCYGPTECTFAVTAARITSREAALPILPVGAVKDGVRITITDESGCALPDGERGEIRICGDSVALGYLDDADGDAFYSAEGVRAYRTGDCGYRQNGLLFVTGRKDRQLKLSGFRVEPGEIENTLLRMDRVRSAVVLARKDAQERVLYLQAFVQTRPFVPPESLRAALAETLPGYMLPRIRCVDAIPLTENGKCDTEMLWKLPEKKE